jgi:hypothetical protein
MKSPSPGFSFTYLCGWIMTVAVVAFALVICGSNAKSPAIVLASEVLIVTSISLLAIVPFILLSMLRNTRRAADYLQEISERQAETGGAGKI